MTARIKAILALALLPPLVGGCKTDHEVTGTGTGSGTETGATSGGSTGSTDGTGDGTGQGTTGDASALLAEGIHIARVQVNQGVQINVFEDGAWVPGADRKAPLIPGRTMMVRAVHEVDADWQPREIEAVLTLNDGGEETQLPVKQMVTGNANLDQPNTNFGWILDREDVTPGLTFQVKLYEVEAGLGVEENPEVVAPGQPQPFGIEPEGPTLDVVLVRVNEPGCNEEPLINDIRVAQLRDWLLELHPVVEVNVSVRDTAIDMPQEADSCVYMPLISQLNQARVDDGNPPETLYIGVTGCMFPGCSCGAESWTYHAIWNESALTHCSGLALGRVHASCTGDEPGPDPNYPYPNGEIGGYGFSVVDYSLCEPDTPSYVSYCTGKNWVSDYGWNEVWDELVP